MVRGPWPSSNSAKSKNTKILIILSLELKLFIKGEQVSPMARDLSSILVVLTT